MQKNNKTTLVTMVIGSLLIGTISTAAIAKKPMHGPKINQEQVLKELNLNDKVRASLQALMNKQKAEMDSLHKVKQQQRYQAHQEKKVIQDVHKEQVKALLSAEQFAAFERAMWVQHQQRNKGRKMHGQPPRR